MNENFDRYILLIKNVFSLAHQDAHRGDPDALDFLQCYGVKPRAQSGHRIIGSYKRGPRRKRANQFDPSIGPSAASAKV